MRPSQAVLVAAVCCVAVTGQLARGQDDTETPQSPTRFDEEVIVRGMPLGLLRQRIREAEEAMYSRFNEINSNDEFDIFCKSSPELGSKVPRRRCLPNYWRDAETDIGVETARSMQGSAYALNTQMFIGMQQYKSQLMTEELRRLIREDEALRRSVVHLANLQQTLSDDNEIRRLSKATTDREVAAGVDGLAFDANAVFEVRLGRKPWTHDLAQRTFTIARVFGEIRNLEVDCDDGDAQLEQEAGIEWTLPDSWGACTLVVDGARDTTFALYEFE